MRGTVTDTRTGLALAAATVTLYALDGGPPLATVETDNQGRYSVAVVWGSYRVAVERSGYLPAAASPVYVVGGQTTAQDMALASPPKFYLPMIFG